MERHHHEHELIEFLQQKLKISHAEMAVALQQREQDAGPLPMILWQYGLITLDQLSLIFDWIESASLANFQV